MYRTLQLVIPKFTSDIQEDSYSECAMQMQGSPDVITEGRLKLQLHEARLVVERVAGQVEVAGEEALVLPAAHDGVLAPQVETDWQGVGRIDGVRCEGIYKH